MELRIFGRIRKLFEGLDSESPGLDRAQLTLNSQLELFVAAGAAPLQEIVKMGAAFWIGNAPGSAVAGVVAIPTTAVILALYNNSPDGGPSMVIDWVAASGVAKTAAAGQQQMLGLIGQLRETAPANSALVAKKRNGLGRGTGSPDTIALSIVGGTALPATTGVATNWFPLGPSFGSPGAAATPGHGAFQQVNGDIIVPPGRYFAMHVLADVVGSTYLGFIGWHEKQLLLG